MFPFVLESLSSWDCSGEWDTDVPQYHTQFVVGLTLWRSQTLQHCLSTIPNQKDTLSCLFCTDSTALLATGEPALQDKVSYAVWKSLGGAAGDPGLLRPVPAVRTRLPCSRLVLSQTKALRLPVNYAHLFDFAEKYSQIQCQLCACHLPAETCDCVWPDAAAEGSSKGSQTEVQGTKFKAEILYRQCVWSRPAFLVGEAEEESQDCIRSSLDWICKRK